MREMWNAAPDVRAAKALVLFALRGIAARLPESSAPPEPMLYSFLYDALALLACDMDAEPILSYAAKILQAAL